MVDQELEIRDLLLKHKYVEGKYREVRVMVWEQDAKGKKFGTGRIFHHFNSNLEARARAHALAGDIARIIYDMKKRKLI